EIAAFQFTTVGFAQDSKSVPQMRMGQMVSDNFFSAMGVQPALGRGFLAGEGQAPGRDAIAWLSHQSWENEFGSDPSVISRAIRMNGVDFTVVGVLPESFTGVDQWVRPAFYIPITMASRVLPDNRVNALEDRGNRMFNVKARLKPGISREAAQAEL